MAGFMAGFGSAFAQSFENQRTRDAQREDDLFKMRFTAAREHVDEVRKQKAQDAKDIAFAKAAVEGTATPEAWTEIYKWRKSGMSDSMIMDRIQNGTFDIRTVAPDQLDRTPSTDDPSAGTDLGKAAGSSVSAHMTTSGMPMPQEGQGIFAQTMGALGLKPSTREQRVDRRVAQAMGMSPDELQKEMNRDVKYDPDPLPGDPSKAIMYKPKPKLPNLNDIDDVIIAREMAKESGDTKSYEMYDRLVGVLQEHKMQDLQTEDDFKIEAEKRAAAQEQLRYLRGRKDDLSDYERGKRDELEQYSRTKADKQEEYRQKRIDELIDHTRSREEAQSDYERGRRDAFEDYVRTRTDQIADMTTKRGYDLQDDKRDRERVVADRAEDRTNVEKDMQTRRDWDVEDRDLNHSRNVAATGQKRVWDLQDQKTAQKQKDIDFERGIDTPAEAIAARERATSPEMRKYYDTLFNELSAFEERKAGFDAKAKGFIQPDSATVIATGEIVRKREDGYYNAQGQRFGLDDVMPHTPQMFEDAENILKETKEPRQQYVEAAQSYKNSVRLANEMNAIVQKNEGVLTFAGDISQFVSKLRRDISETIKLVSDDQNPFLNKEVEKALANEEEKLQQLATRTDDLAVQKALLEAKATRMAYAQAASVGQVGKAVAVQEFERMYDNILNKGGGKRGFEQGMAEWLAGEENRLRTMEAGLNQNNQNLEMFKTKWGIPAPVATAPSLDAILGGERSNLQAPQQDTLKPNTLDTLPMPEEFPDGPEVWNELPPNMQEYFLNKIKKVQ